MKVELGKASHVCDPIEVNRFGEVAIDVVSRLAQMHQYITGHSDSTRVTTRFCVVAAPFASVAVGVHFSDRNNGRVATHRGRPDAMQLLVPD